MSTKSAQRDVVLLGKPHNAFSLSTVVGGHGTLYIPITFDEHTYHLSVNTINGHVVEDSRLKAEFMLRSFLNNQGKILFHFQRHFSVWQRRDANDAPPIAHYTSQIEPAFDMAHIRDGTYKVEAYNFEKTPSLALLNKDNDAVFFVVCKALIKDIISIHNEENTKSEKHLKIEFGELCRASC